MEIGALNARAHWGRDHTQGQRDVLEEIKGQAAAIGHSQTVLGQLKRSLRHPLEHHARAIIKREFTGKLGSLLPFPPPVALRATEAKCTEDITAEIKSSGKSLEVEVAGNLVINHSELTHEAPFHYEKVTLPGDDKSLSVTKLFEECQRVAAIRRMPAQFPVLLGAVAQFMEKNHDHRDLTATFGYKSADLDRAMSQIGLGAPGNAHTSGSAAHVRTPSAEIGSRDRPTLEFANEPTTYSAKPSNIVKADRSSTQRPQSPTGM